MTTLLIRLSGPMQAWGTQSRFTIRDTGLEPSKSGVIGLLCAALGKPRAERAGDGFPTLAELANLSMGVRADCPGVMRMDYHTAGGTHRRGDSYGVAKADGSRPDTVTSRRYYLADADFLVGLEGPAQLLRTLCGALERPRWQLFLGRKSFVPSARLTLPAEPPWNSGWRELPLSDALGLTSCPWLGHLEQRHRSSEPQSLRIVLDSAATSSDVRPDLPISFAPRRFALRYVTTQWISPAREDIS